MAQSGLLWLVFSCFATRCQDRRRELLTEVRDSHPGAEAELGTESEPVFLKDAFGAGLLEQRAVRQLWETCGRVFVRGQETRAQRQETSA